MSSKPSLASDSPAFRRLRQCAPLLVVMVLMALALTPGVVSGDRSFQISLCADHQQSEDACALLRRAAMVERNLTSPAEGPRGSWSEAPPGGAHSQPTDS